MDLIDRVSQNFQDNIQHTQISLELAAESIATASHAITQSLLSGGKILACGNATSANNARLLCNNMLNIYDKQRPGLPAIALDNDAGTLTAIANNESIQQVYARQINALGQADDLLLVITSKQDAAIESAVHAAHHRDMRVIALTSITTGSLGEIMEANDIEIRTSTENPARADELHHLVINCLCDLTDQQLLGM